MSSARLEAVATSRLIAGLLDGLGAPLATAFRPPSGCELDDERRRAFALLDFVVRVAAPALLDDVVVLRAVEPIVDSTSAIAAYDVIHRLPAGELLHAATDAIVRADAAIAVGRGQPHPLASAAPAVHDYFFSYDTCLEHAGSAAGDLIATALARLPDLDRAVRDLLRTLGARAALGEPWHVASTAAAPACAIADEGCYLVAQGTGSISGGLIAARLVADLLPLWLRMADVAEAGIHDHVAEVLARVGSAIAALEQHEPFYRGMRASFAAAIVRERALWIVWAGDVEVARWRGGVAERLTRPHLGAATNAISRSVGSSHIDFERRIETWEPGDRLVIITADAREHGDDVAAVQASGIGAVLVAAS